MTAGFFYACTFKPPVFLQFVSAANSQWHDYLEDPTLADAILDRLIHCAHKLDLKGDNSMRKVKGSLTEDEHLR